MHIWGFVQVSLATTAWLISSIFMFSSIQRKYSDIRPMIFILQGVNIILCLFHLTYGALLWEDFWANRRNTTRLYFRQFIQTTVVSAAVFDSSILTHLISNSYFYDDKNAYGYYLGKLLFWSLIMKRIQESK